MFDPRRVLLVGATGSVGSAVMRQADVRAGVELVALARRQPAMRPAASVETIVADPAEWPTAVAATATAPDAVICALGTTWRKAGKSETAFRAVDQDLVLAVARAARGAGARRFVHISSVGADPRARTFYLRVKGEVEEALQELDFQRLDVLRPGLLRGPRAGDRRLGERLAILLSLITDRMLRGGLRRYRSIDAGRVAAAALGTLNEKAGGRFVHEHNAIVRLSSRTGGPT